MRIPNRLSWGMLTALLWIGIMVPHRSVLAQTNPSGQDVEAITTAVPFLQIAPDAKSGAMGDAGVAITDNANAIHWNPAAMATFDDQMGFSTSYTPWLRGLGIPDINLGYLPGYYNFGKKGGVVGVAFRFFSLGEIQFTDDAGLETGRFNANEFSIAASYAHVLTDKLSIGGSLRYIRSNLAGSGNVGGISTNPGQSAAADIAFHYQTDFDLNTQQGSIPVKFRAGSNISNIGSKMNYTSSSQRDFIPTNLRIGYAFTADLDEFNQITFTNDFNKLMVPSEGGASDDAVLEGMFSSFGDAEGGLSEEMKEVTLSFGAEYMYNQIFGIRAGFFHESPDKGDRQFMTLGAALQFNIFSLDFAFLIPFQENHPLERTLRFTLAFDFK